MNIRNIFFSVLFIIIPVQVMATPIKYWQTSQGARVYFVQTKDLPMLDMRLLFSAGSARDADKKGIAALTARLLKSGTNQWNANQIAQRFDAVGAQYTVDTQRDYTAHSLRTLTQDDLLTRAFNTFQALITQPKFSQENFQRIKNQVLMELKQQQEQPRKIAQKAFYKALYGEHPYAHLTKGSLETVNKISRADIQKFYQQYYVSNNAILAIVGDITEQQARLLADKLFTAMPSGKKAQDLPKVIMPMTAKTHSIDFPSTQTHILVGLPVLTRQDADYFPLYVGNHILGGSGLVSKLVDEIREKRGLAYSAYSYFSPLAEAGPFIMGLQTRNKKSQQALDVLLQTLQTFIKQGPTQAELTAAQKNITGGFVLRFDNHRKLLNYVAMIGFYQLPLNYLETFPSQVMQVSVEQIKSAFQRRILEQKLQIIQVGSQ